MGHDIILTHPHGWLDNQLSRYSVSIHQYITATNLVAFLVPLACSFSWIYSHYPLHSHLPSSWTFSQHLYCFCCFWLLLSFYILVIHPPVFILVSASRNVVCVSAAMLLTKRLLLCSTGPTQESSNVSHFWRPGTSTTLHLKWHSQMTVRWRTNIEYLCRSDQWVSELTLAADGQRGLVCTSPYQAAEKPQIAWPIY